jgi:hypothetical protein
MEINGSQAQTSDIFIDSNNNRTQASYELYDSNAIVQMMFKKCMKTKQEKIEKQRILNNYGIKFNNKEMTKICQETDKHKIEKLK